MQPFKLASTFVVVDPKLSAVKVDVGPTLYQDIDREFSQFQRCTLISEYTFEQDWETWEMHPAGDEILYLVSGKVEIRLLDNGREHSLRMDVPGTSVIVPKGRWHTARVAEKSTVLFVTPGEGTVNAVDPRAGDANRD